MRDYSLLINKKIYFRNILVFLFFSFIFLLYHLEIEYSNFLVYVILNLLILIIFILTAFRPKAGLYVFIFFIPLLDTAPILFKVIYMDIPLYLFFGFFLGFLLSFFEKDFKNRLNYLQSNYFDEEIRTTILVFLGIIIISLALTIFRYSNFHPLITSSYHNLKVNLNGLLADSAISWIIKYFINYVIGFLLLFAVFNIIDKKRDIVNALIILFFSTGIVSLFAVYQYYFNPTLGNLSQWADSGRVNSTFTDPNALGAYCVIIFPIIFAFVIFAKKWYLRIAIYLLFVLFIMAAIFSGSRTALLGILLTLFIFLIYAVIRYIKYLKRTSDKKRILNLCIVLPIIFIILVSFTVTLFTENQIKDNFLKADVFKRTTMSVDTFIFHLKEYGIGEAFKSISNYRYFYWGMAVNMAKDYPASGVGVGSYIIELPDYLRRFGAGAYQNNGLYQVDFVGNYYLQVLSELGLPGLITSLFIFFLIIKKTILYFNFKRKTGNPEIDDRFLFGIFLSFIISLIALIFGPHTNYNSIQLIFWLVIAIILSYIKFRQISILKISSVSNKYIDFYKIKKPLLLTSNIKFTTRQKIAIFCIFFVFLSSFILSSSTSLSIYAKQNKCNFENNYGFYNFEKFEGRDVRWVAKEASMKIKKDGNSLILQIQDGYPYKDLEHLPLPIPLTAKIFVDNLYIKTVNLDNDSWYNVKIFIPDFIDDWFTITLVFNRSWIPKELGLNSDTKELGARVGEFEFK